MPIRFLKEYWRLEKYSYKTVNSIPKRILVNDKVFLKKYYFSVYKFLKNYLIGQYIIFLKEYFWILQFSKRDSIHKAIGSCWEDTGKKNNGTAEISHSYLGFD